MTIMHVLNLRVSVQPSGFCLAYGLLFNIRVSVIQVQGLYLNRYLSYKKRVKCLRYAWMKMNSWTLISICSVCNLLFCHYWSYECYLFYVRDFPHWEATHSFANLFPQILRLVWVFAELRPVSITLRSDHRCCTLSLTPLFAYIVWLWELGNVYRLV